MRGTTGPGRRNKYKKRVDSRVDGVEGRRNLRMGTQFSSSFTMGGGPSEGSRREEDNDTR